MLKTIYYVIGIFMFLYNLKYLTKISEFSKVSEWMEAFKRVHSRRPTTDEILSKDTNSLYSYYHIYSAIEIFWLGFGILTSDWLLYLIVFILSYFTRGLWNKYLLGSIYTIKTLLILFLIVNGIHFHIDTYLIIKQFFSNLF